MTLQELEKRLSEASGAYQLDAPLADAIDRAFPLEVEPDIRYMLIQAARGSVDAAIALAERVLPDHRWIVDKDCDRAPKYAAQVKARGATWRETSRPFANTPALALCLAIVRALIAKEGKQ
jgi:hypothetical protein